MAALPVQHAFADGLDTFNVSLGGGVTHDSNVFRVAEDPQSDTISKASAGLSFNKPYAQQRFQAQVNKHVTRYDNFSHLNFEGLNYSAEWQWRLTSKLSGTLSADHSEELAAFEDTIGRQRNIRDTDNEAFTLDWSAFGRWHLLFGFSRSKQTSEEQFQPEPDFRSITGEAGVRYDALSGSSIALTRRSTQGDYLNSAPNPADAVENGYNEYETGVEAIWIASPLSTLTARLAWVERENERLTQRDFSGPVGSLGYKWSPMQKLSLEWTGSRRIFVYQSAFSTYVVDYVVSFAPTWQASEKVALLMRLEHVESDYRGGLLATTLPDRNDSTSTALLGATWMLSRNATLGASVQYQNRSSNQSLNDYDATIATISASLIF